MAKTRKSPDNYENPGKIARGRINVFRRFQCLIGCCTLLSLGFRQRFLPHVSQRSLGDKLLRSNYLKTDLDEKALHGNPSLLQEFSHLRSKLLMHLSKRVVLVCQYYTCKLCGSALPFVNLFGFG